MLQNRARTVPMAKSSRGQGASKKQKARPPPGDFLVVALGASAGGLEALNRFFDALPAETGMAYVLIQHLDPTHKSMMVDLLAGHTSMTALEAANDMPVAPNHVYVIPPGAYLALEGGVFRVTQPRERHGARMPFDHFLQSLAEDRGARAACVVLSGTGSDGSLGIKAIHDRGGLVVAQDPNDAGHDGMPRSAIDTGLVDSVLPAVAVPAYLLKYGGQARPKPKLVSSSPARERCCRTGGNLRAFARTHVARLRTLQGGHAPSPDSATDEHGVDQGRWLVPGKNPPKSQRDRASCQGHVDQRDPIFPRRKGVRYTCGDGHPRACPSPTVGPAHSRLGCGLQQWRRNLFHRDAFPRSALHPPRKT